MNKIVRSVLAYLFLGLPTIWIYLTTVSAVDPYADMLYSTGQTGIYFLFLSISITPFRHATKVNVTWLNKIVGLMTFFYVCLHSGIYFLVDGFGDILKPFVLSGAVAGFILLLMAVTSNRLSQKRLKKMWKYLHRFVYVAIVAVIYHALSIEKHPEFVPVIVGFGIWMFLNIVGRIRRHLA